MPARPYFSSHNLIRELEAYYKAAEEARARWLAPYNALLLVGGSGPIVDLANNQRVHDIILSFLKVQKPIGAECVVACLAFARDWETRKTVIWGKRVTGHCKDYDCRTARALWALTSIWARLLIPWNTFSVIRGPRVPTLGISVRKHRSSLTIRSSLAAQPPIRLSPVKRWWRSWKKV